MLGSYPVLLTGGDVTDNSDGSHGDCESRPTDDEQQLRLKIQTNVEWRLKSELWHLKKTCASLCGKISIVFCSAGVLKPQSQARA